MQLSIVIPTFNSELIIDKLVKQIENEKFYSYEIVIVNDCSTDETYKKLIALKKNFSNLKIINLQSNIGQVGATLCGVEKASGEVIVTMDDDLQHDPKYIEKLIKEIQNKNYDIVVAKWGLDETIVRNLGSYFFSIISSFLILKSINFRNTAFRAIKKEYKEEFINFFITRYWIDPRRINAKISQISIPHQNQTFRPYSTFKSRITLATQHILLDTYLVHLLMILILINNLYFLATLLLFFTSLQYMNKNFLRKKRKNAFLNSN